MHLPIPCNINVVAIFLSAAAAAVVQVLFTACVDGNVRAWDARTGVCTSLFTGHTDMILDMRLVDPRSSSSSPSSPQGVTSAGAAGGGAGAADVPVLIVTASDDNASKIFRWPSAEAETAASAAAAVTPSA